MMGAAIGPEAGMLLDWLYVAVVAVVGIIMAAFALGGGGKAPGLALRRSVRGRGNHHGGVAAGGRLAAGPPRRLSAEAPHLRVRRCPLRPGLGAVQHPLLSLRPGLRAL